MNYGTENFSASTNQELNVITAPQKKRRTSVKASRASQQNIGPPMLSDYGDTIVVSNPFDDAPESMKKSINCQQGQCSYSQNYLSGKNAQIHNYQNGMSMNNGQIGQNVETRPNNDPSICNNWSELNTQNNQSTIKKKPTKRAQNQNSKRSQATKRKTSAKIYPSGQPVIFNSANPHAPPIYPCGVCFKEVTENDQGIICESGCNFWFHRTCLGLSEAAFIFLTHEIYAEWACDNCLRSKNIPMVKFKPA